ncbi:MAG TPA: CAAX prenyl protease-related protein [Verrucomicrobiae bacterium]|jgi:CAAX prenyl protease-like protein|nr:CAAX prenyl protease-related protein [Verrucomicrobiae bacterium]
MNLLPKNSARYVLPFLVFLLLTELQRFGTPQSIFWIYGFKIAVTTAVLLFLFRGRGAEISGRFDPAAAGLGLIVLAIWIVLGNSIPAERGVSFDPGVFANVPVKAFAVGLRILGAAVLVPVIEELFWRSFLMRAFVNQEDFLSVPLGAYTRLSFWGTVAAFMLVHRSWEWPATFLTGALYGGYLLKTKNLKGCILAHAVTNFGLAVYVLLTHRWYFW